MVFDGNSIGKSVFESRQDDVNDFKEAIDRKIIFPPKFVLGRCQIRNLCLTLMVLLVMLVLARVEFTRNYINIFR